MTQQGHLVSLPKNQARGISPTRQIMGIIIALRAGSMRFVYVRLMMPTEYAQMIDVI
jgi:hypothetical protein